MTTAIEPTPNPETTPTQPVGLSWRERLSNNPMVLKEMRGRMRGNRAIILLTVYLVIMSGLALLLYTAYASTTSTSFGSNVQLAGKVLFGGLVFIELLAVCFVTPAFTSGAISGERERQTYDLLRTTLLPARSLVLGKLTSALSFILLLMIAAVPLQSLAFMLGGVALEELVLSIVMLLVTALVFGAAGMFSSAVMRRTLGASVMTYAFALATTLGLPLILLMILPFLGMVGWSNPQQWWVETAMILGLWLLVSLNPVAAAGMTAWILTEEQSVVMYFYGLSTAGYGFTPIQTLPLPSPWILYTGFYLALSLILIFLSITRVRQKDQ